MVIVVCRPLPISPNTRTMFINKQWSKTSYAALSCQQYKLYCQHYKLKIKYCQVIFMDSHLTQYVHLTVFLLIKIYLYGFAALFINALHGEYSGFLPP
jgi:hypothetical protein